ncbi:uncharacterized protein [Triticum aestivum]|uniref:uncharacterized protein isoform X2 n=1 Tax=Triticum aestivum TaxID=4565 RepID=UPI001D006064|nr:uncharacterized protein LOC123112924 isoform X2 [Triticum aestivum]
MTAIRSLVSSSSSSEGNAILAANVFSAGDGSPIMSVIRALIGASSLSELGSFSIYQGSAYASRELVPVYQGSAYGFRELVPASYRRFHPCKVLPVSLTSNRNSSLMLVNILLGAWFGGYLLASTDGQPGSFILENLKEKLKLIEAEIRDLERMIEEFASDFMKLMKQKLERLKVLKEDLLKLLEDFQAVDDVLRKMLDELSADKDLTKEDLAVICKKLMELEAPPEKELLEENLDIFWVLGCISPRQTSMIYGREERKESIKV